MYKASAASRLDWVDCKCFYFTDVRKEGIVFLYFSQSSFVTVGRPFWRLAGGDWGSSSGSSLYAWWNSSLAAISTAILDFSSNKPQLTDKQERLISSLQVIYRLQISGYSGLCCSIYILLGSINFVDLDSPDRLLTDLKGRRLKLQIAIVHK